MFFLFLFPCLLGACLGVVPWVLKLWGKNLILPAIVSSSSLVMLYLYSGIRVGQSEALPQLRQLFLAHILHDPRVLFGLCLALGLLLSASLLCGIRSQTLSFESETEVEVFHLQGDGHSREKSLGYATAQKPLVRRFFSGTRRFKFEGEGFESEVRFVPVASTWMSGREHRVRIELPLMPEFDLLDFGTRAEVFDSSTDGILPASLRSWPGATLRLTLATISKAPLRVQNLRIVVEDVQPLRKSTFPVDGLGGDGDPPLIGYVELVPQKGQCEVVVNKTTQGDGAKPQDYLILAVSRPGYRYRVHAQLRWTDARDPRRGGEHLFEEVQQLDFPSVVPWQELVKGALRVRVLLYDRELLSQVSKTLLSLRPHPRCSALLRSGEADLLVETPSEQLEEQSQQQATGFESVAVASKSQQAELARLVGESYGHAREFMMIDEHTLLVQDPEDPSLAEIVTDLHIINLVAEAFDAFFD